MFYANKGRLYAYYLLLRALGADFAKVIHERDLDRSWPQMLESFRSAAGLQPWVVVNGDPAASSCPAIWRRRASFCCAPAPSLGKSAASC